jgi:hypothetical protein
MHTPTRSQWKKTVVREASLDKKIIHAVGVVL